MIRLLRAFLVLSLSLKRPGERERDSQRFDTRAIKSSILERNSFRIGDVFTDLGSRFCA